MSKAYADTGRIRSKEELRASRPTRPTRPTFLTRLPRLALTACLVLVVALALFAFSGCKYSDVLTQHLEDPELGQTDENADPVYQPNPESDVILDLAELSIDESDIIDTQAQVMPHYDPNAPDNGPTTQRIYSKETPHDEEASEGEEPEEEEEQEQEGDRSGAGVGEEEGTEASSDGDGQASDQEEEKEEEPQQQEEQEEPKEPEQPEQEPEQPEQEPEQPAEEPEQPEQPEPAPEPDPEEEPEENNNAGGEDTSAENPPEHAQNPSPTDNPSDALGDNEGSGEVGDEQSEKQQQSGEEGGGGGTTVIVDPEQGTNEETTKGAVAAVGEYATIAQMLGGPGALVAADASWLSVRAQDGCFKGELEQVITGFSGDGSTSGSCDVDALIEAKPASVLWDGTSPALSSSERQALEKAGIKIQNVPTLGAQNTEDYTVTQAVQMVASVLSEAGGLSYDPVATAQAYLKYHDDILRASYNSNGGYSYKVTDSSYPALYQSTPLSGLDKSTTTRTITAYVDDLMIPGVSTAKLSQSTNLLSDGTTLQLLHNGKDVDVSDGVGLSAAVNSSSYLLIDYYLQLAGVMNNAYDTAQPESQGRRYILMPGTTNAFGTSKTYASRSTGTALFFNTGDATVPANWHYLGGGDFPAIITANEDIASALNKSASKSDGLYRMDLPYRIMVVPSGVAGSWAEGHIDSFLLSRWAFGLGNTANLSAVEPEVDSFYSVFLRCSNWRNTGAVKNWDDPIYTTASG